MKNFDVILKKKTTIQGISSEGNESKRPGKVFQNL